MSQLLRAAIDEVAKRKCECVHCAACSGTGRFEQWDVTSYCDVDECPECDGHAILEICPRCMEMEELYQLLEEQENQALGKSAH